MGEKRGLLERLESEPILCAEGYVFELERRGYLQAGPFIPEAVLDHPEVVQQLHRDFVHAGSDVVEAVTYYAHREKLRLIGRQDELEALNRQALRLAREVAEESGALLAGNICNTNVYEPGDERAIRAMFEEQVGWAAEAEVDYVIGETFSWLGEALLALEAIRAAGKPAVLTLAIPRHGLAGDGLTPTECCRRLEDGGAAVVGMNCLRGPATMLPLIQRIRSAARRVATRARELRQPLLHRWPPAPRSCMVSSCSQCCGGAWHERRSHRGLDSANGTGLYYEQVSGKARQR